MERQVELGFVTQLGISNLHDVRRFERIYEEAAVKPRVLQNRFSPQLGARSSKTRRDREMALLPKARCGVSALLGPLRERPAAANRRP